MGYACPVCEAPQADAGHLANHVAFTALTGNDAHEAWLDETVPEWGQLGEAELSDILVDHAEEAEYPDVFEDTTGPSQDHSHHSHGHGHQPGAGRRGQGPPQLSAGGNGGPPADDGSLSADDRAVLAEARDLTREMLAEGDAADDSAASDPDSGDDGPPAASSEDETE